MWGLRVQGLGFRLDALEFWGDVGVSRNLRV